MYSATNIVGPYRQVGFAVRGVSLKTCKFSLASFHLCFQQSMMHSSHSETLLADECSLLIVDLQSSRGSGPEHVGAGIYYKNSNTDHNQNINNRKYGNNGSKNALAGRFCCSSELIALGEAVTGLISDHSRMQRPYVSRGYPRSPVHLNEGI